MSESRRAVPGSFVRVLARTGRTILALRCSCRQIARRTGYSFSDRGTTGLFDWTWYSRFSMGSRAKTVRCRACSNSPASPTSAATYRVLRSAWTSPYLVARSAGIATPTFWTVGAGEKVDPDTLPYPVFVKPARSGSSFGVSQVRQEEELVGALNEARQFDAKVLIEEAVVGSEVGCAILGNDGELVAGEPDRISLSHGFFRIHQEIEPERGSENATFIVPADISSEDRERVQETAKTLYRALGCRGLARVDVFLKEDGTVVLNEVNTLPGLTSYSRYPRMMAAAGLSLAEVIGRVVSLALEER
jgi:D-ala D-ala ligase C-terminus